MQTSTTSVSFVSEFRRLLKNFYSRPRMLLVLTTVYMAAAGSYFLYQEQRRRALELKKETSLLQTEVNAMANERQALVQRASMSTGSVDLFKPLQFGEKVHRGDEESFALAKRLNSYARYAIEHRDLEKAMTTLEESITVYPTLEADYYEGVVQYLQGNAPNAIASWTKVANTQQVPRDIFLYLSVAEYKQGNVDGAKRFADQYSKSTR